MRPLFLICLLYLGVTFTGAAQQRQQELDSLIQIAEDLPDGIEKAKVLSRIHERMMFKDPELANKYAQEAYDLSKRIHYDRGIANGYLQFGNYYSNRSENDSANYYYTMALNQFKTIGSVRGQIFANHALADLQRQEGAYDSAIAITRKTISLYNEENRKSTDLKGFNLLGAEYETLGKIYYEKGSYRLALEETLKAVVFFENTKDEVRRADNVKQLGDIEFQQENYKESLRLYKDAFSVYKKNEDKIYLAYTANAAGLAAEKLGDHELAKNYFEQAISLSRGEQLLSVLSNSLKDLSRLYSKSGQFLEAKALLAESYSLAKKTKIKLDLTATLYEMANLDLKTKNLAGAMMRIGDVIAIADSIGALPTLSEAYLTRSEVHVGLKNYNAALKDYKMYSVLKDSIYNSRKSQQIEELKTIYETEKKEAALTLKEEEIKTLNAKAKVDKLTKGLYAGGMFSGVALSGLLFFGFRQRMKRNKLAREKQEEIYLQEIEHKKRELASQTLHLVQKNTFIQELKENLENLKSSPEKFKVEFRRIVMLLKKQSAEDKDWEVFKTYFSDVHNDFDQKLKTIYSEITEKEIRLAAFLRMNLSTKEIATMLNVMPDSILKSKYRLKKKLQLDKETDLTGFLNTL